MLNLFFNFDSYEKISRIVDFFTDFSAAGYLRFPGIKACGGWMAAQNKNHCLQHLLGHQCFFFWINAEHCVHQL